MAFEKDGTIANIGWANLPQIIRDVFWLSLIIL